MGRTQDIAIRAASALLVYGAIVTGMHLLKSGWFAILAYHGVLCLALTAAGAWPTVIRKLASGWEPRFGGIAIAACAAAGPLIYVFWPEMRLGDLTMKAAFASIGMEGVSIVAFIAYYSTVNPVLEELFWRGWFAAGCRRPWAADLLFGGYHIFVVLSFVTIPHVGAVFGVLWSVGFAWREITRRLGGLIVPVVSHAAADLSIIVAAYLLVRSS